MLIGHGSDGDVYISESERESHVHIVGGPGSGKSKLLEYLIRHDIRRLHEDQLAGIDPKDGRSCGLCFLDPSEDGDTIRKILAYCEEIGFDKILLIDPLTYHSHQKLPAINPFSAYKTYWSMASNSLVDAFRVVYEVEDISRTSFIKTYLAALFGLMQFAGLTASDLACFSVSPDKQDPKNAIEELLVQEGKRQQIYELARARITAKDFPGIWRDIAYKHLAEVQFAYSSIPNFVREAGSSARRLNVLVANPILKLIFGHRQGANFDKLVSEGWVILVNVSEGSELGTLEARLLGTVVVNQIISSIKRVRKHGFNKPYYLYIDEAGDFVTYTLADILAKKRKIGLRTVLAHQYLGQLEDRLIREAIETCTDIKCGFYISHQKHRKEIVEMLGYGGDLNPTEVTYNLSSQKQREMVVRLSKQPPQLVRVPDTPDSTGNVGAFLNRLFEDLHYYTLKDIKEDENKRFEGAKGVHKKPPAKRKVANSQTASSAEKPPNTIFDD